MVLRLRALLAPVAEAEILQARGTALFTTDQLPEAVRARAAAVRIREELGEPGPLGEARAPSLTTST